MTWTSAAEYEFRQKVYMFPYSESFIRSQVFCECCGAQAQPAQETESEALFLSESWYGRVNYHSINVRLLGKQLLLVGNDGLLDQGMVLGFKVEHVAYACI